MLPMIMRERAEFRLLENGNIIFTAFNERNGQRCVAMVIELVPEAFFATLNGPDGALDIEEQWLEWHANRLAGNVVEFPQRSHG